MSASDVIRGNPRREGYAAVLLLAGVVLVLPTFGIVDATTQVMLGVSAACALVAAYFIGFQRSEIDVKSRIVRRYIEPTHSISIAHRVDEFGRVQREVSQYGRTPQIIQIKVVLISKNGRRFVFACFPALDRSELRTHTESLRMAREIARVIGADVQDIGFPKEGWSLAA